MILYLNARTKSRDVCIDCIHLKLSDGTEALLTWDESNIFRSSEGFSARYKGVYLDEDYANGKLNSLIDCKVTEFSFESAEDKVYPVEVTSMTLVDGQEIYSIALDKRAGRKAYSVSVEVIGHFSIDIDAETFEDARNIARQQAGVMSFGPLENLEFHPTYAVDENDEEMEYL